MEGAAGLLQQLQLEPGITREMRKCGTIQVRQTESRAKEMWRGEIHGENNRADFIPLSAT